MIEILDCTLRDGGYVNNWEFSNKGIHDIIQSLVTARIEIIECGFLSQKHGSAKDSSRFESIEVINKILSSISANDSNTEFVAMMNFGENDVRQLPKYNPEIKNSISGIRLAFHKQDTDKAIEDAKIIVSKGYKFFAQPMVTLRYSDKELLTLFENLIPLDPYAVYFVDSFGAMSRNDIKRYSLIFHHNLPINIKLGYHAHNNLQLAFSNAEIFLAEVSYERDKIVDSSVFGMGRGAGNLNTELFSDFLNKYYYKDYEIEPILHIIDSYLEAVFKENYWGYSAAHFLSASINCHPNYASYLINMKSLTIKDIQKILCLIDDKKRYNYDKNYIEELYLKYKSSPKKEVNFNPEIFGGKEVLAVASGSNASVEKNKVEEFIGQYNPVVVGLNHIPPDYGVNYLFFSNQKRYNEFKERLSKENLIVTSNIEIEKTHVGCSVVAFEELLSLSSNKSDNVSILFINLLRDSGVNKVNIAGLDGYNLNSEKNYSYQEFDRILDKNMLKAQNENLQTALDDVSKKIKINIVTSTIFSVNI